MGKKQHSKDRMFITKTEWATEWGGAKSDFALTFTPFDTPVYTQEGTYGMEGVPYIRKYGRNSVTGAPLKLADLIPLTFHKNSDGEFKCPVLKKVFTEVTHIVAVKSHGDVFRNLMADKASQ